MNKIMLGIMIMSLISYLTISVFTIMAGTLFDMWLAFGCVLWTLISLILWRRHNRLEKERVELFRQIREKNA